MLVDKANQQDTQLTALQQKIKEYSKTETDMLDARATSEQFSREVKVNNITDRWFTDQTVCYRTARVAWHC